MTRPAVVIGLGGTGQWVLTFVKKDLLEVGQGTLPKNVALLAFDTMPQATAQTERQGGDREVKVGTVKLQTDREFIHVGGNAFELAQGVKAGRYPHISSWYQAEHYLRALPPAAFNLSEGAGTIRQFGRLAVFHDLAQPAVSRIWSYVYSAVQTIRASVTDESALEVIIVGSFAGGTGAGMFIDMALLLRAISTQAVAGNHIVRGFFVLPRAFPVGLGPKQKEMFARTFGAWRELNRFMIVDPDLGLRKMIYHERHREFQIPVEKRAYDVCYLIDAVSGRGSLATRNPEEGLFPSVADAIGAILDDQAGKKYTEHVTTNLSRSFSRHPGQPMYSTVGTYAVKVPVFYVQQEFAHQLALGMLDRVLAPVRDDRGRVTGLLPNANPEQPGKAGSEGVYSFMERESFTRAGEDTVYNTLFLPKVSELMKANADAALNIQTMWAQASLMARRGASPVGWLVPLSKLGDSPEAMALKSDIERTVGLRLVMAVPPSRVAKDRPAEAVSRLDRQIPAFRVQQVGVRDVKGEAVSRGDFGKALEKCRQFQSQIFQRMLRLWLVNTLEGEVDDPIIARSGKLGYAESFLVELVRVLDRFQSFLRKVQTVRQDDGLMNNVANEVNKRRLNYVARANKPGFLAAFTKADYDAQEAYLQAEQKAIDWRQDELLHEVVQETAQEMLDFARRTRDEVQAWMRTLALNPDSVLSRVSSSLDDARVAHTKDRGLSNVQRLLADESLPISNDAVAEALRKLHWRVDREAGGLAVTGSLELVEKGDLRSSPGESVQNLLQYASQRFPAMQEKAVAAELVRFYEGDDKRLAAELNKKAEPLTRTTGTGAEERYCFIRAHSDINDTVRGTFDRFVTELRQLNKETTINLVESEHPFKLTIVQSSDMIRPDDFVAWSECQDAYKQLIDDEPDQAILLQAFPAEVTSAKYERRLEDLRSHWRVFDPKVVMLLEDEGRLSQFLQAWAFGFIRRAQDTRTGRNFYELVIPNTTVQPIQLSDPEKGTDVFVMLNQFLLRGEDVRPSLRQPIRYDWLQDAITAEQARLGREATAHVLESQFKDRDGFVFEQRQKAGDLDRNKPGTGQAYSDLADLTHLMLLDMAAKLRN